MCKKRSYPNEQSALKILNNCHAAGPQRHEKRAYLCTLCFGYHLTSQPARLLR